MSSKKSTNVEHNGYVTRLIEACESDQPAVIARLLDVSYQAAKNYLLGRIPESSVLLEISERTPYSIHWLLTGKGEKLVGSLPKYRTRRLFKQIGAVAREERHVNISERTTNVEEKVIVLRTEDIKDEKVIEKANDSANAN